MCSKGIYDLLKSQTQLIGIKGLTARNFDAYTKACQLHSVVSGGCAAVDP